MTPPGSSEVPTGPYIRAYVQVTERKHIHVLEGLADGEPLYFQRLTDAIQAAYAAGATELQILTNETKASLVFRDMQQL